MSAEKCGESASSATLSPCPRVIGPTGPPENTGVGPDHHMESRPTQRGGRQACALPYL
jgi:hypothetical protein